MGSFFGLIVLVAVNWAFSALIVYGAELSPLPILLMPFTFGVVLTRLLSPVENSNWCRSSITGLLFIAVFLVSSLGALALTKGLFGTDDALPFLSSPTAVLLVLLVLSRWNGISGLWRLAGPVAGLGIAATYLGDWLARLELHGWLATLTTLPFVWQTAVGGPLVLLRREASFAAIE
ncbi:MAG: hypothetical protein AAF627_18245 [Myxococcota bacterium]